MFHVSCCLHMYFLWRHHLPPDKSESDEDSDSDWFTYCIDIWLLTLLFCLQYLSESCFGNDNKFSLPNPWVVLFFIYPTFYSLKILFTQPFSLPGYPPPPPPPPPPPAINNDRSLMLIYTGQILRKTVACNLLTTWIVLYRSSTQLAYVSCPTTQAVHATVLGKICPV
jgi:hypothetical protein